MAWIFAIPAWKPFVLKLNWNTDFAVNTSMSISDPYCNCRITVSASAFEKMHWVPVHPTG